MMTTMLAFTFLTLIALFFVLKRLCPLSQTTKINELKDANNNLNHSSSIEDDSDESALPLSSKNCYVTLIQHDDEQNQYLYNKNSKNNSLTKRLSNIDSQRCSPTNNSLHFDTSSTNILCLSDEQQRTINNDLTKSSSIIS
jgi:hypothetical protein